MAACTAPGEKRGSLIAISQFPAGRMQGRKRWDQCRRNSNATVQAVLFVPMTVLHGWRKASFAFSWMDFLLGPKPGTFPIPVLATLQNVCG
jgi:hypothetical protein